MLTLLSVGLPLAALAALAPVYRVFLANFHHIEPLFMKAMAFNLFEHI